MGWNTTVVINNDALGDIAGDPEFGSILGDCIFRFYRNEGKPLEIVARREFEGDIVSISCNAGMVVSSNMSCSSSVVLVGGNRGVKLMEFYSDNLNELEIKEKICRELASELGLEVSKVGLKND